MVFIGVRSVMPILSNQFTKQTNYTNVRMLNEGQLKTPHSLVTEQVERIWDHGGVLGQYFHLIHLETPVYHSPVCVI